ncbi:MAG: DUF3991 domain-containing protein, partial [Verrucomicrobia bacterium]|nr:DUF3991 domain-containing protein [Verrucomicrobiota bacterium]
IREGPRGSAWFAHRDPAGLVMHVDVRGPTYKGSLPAAARASFAFLTAVRSAMGGSCSPRRRSTP